MSSRIHARRIQARNRVLCGVVVCLCTLAAPGAANLSEIQADAFARKLTEVASRGVAPPEATLPSRTRFTEGELNSWVTYRGEEVLPAGVSGMQLTLLGAGMVRGDATVDLKAIGREQAGSAAGGPWSYLGGRVPVSVTGQLHTSGGTGRFDLQSASISGVPVPKAVLADMLAYYSRTAEDPAGIRLADPFPLPSGIQRIEIGLGQAIVVQ
jgi:hypothetical protein